MVTLNLKVEIEFVRDISTSGLDVRIEGATIRVLTPAFSQRLVGQFSLNYRFVPQKEFFTLIANQIHIKQLKEVIVIFRIE